MYYLIVSIILGFFFVLFNKYIAKKINLHDVPDSERKIHHKKTALTGGIFFFFNIIIYLIFEKYFITNNYSGLFFSSNSSDNIFILSIILLFLIGFIDDKIKLDHNLRFFLLILIISLNLLLTPELNISLIKVSFFKPFEIGEYSFFWTLICFLLFINAFNFFDGLNLQTAGLILIMSIFFVHKNIYTEFFLVIIVANFFFLYLNYQSKIFLGNNGSYFIPFIFGSYFIKAYNSDITILADEIVVLLLIPGLDLLRLFFQRILNKKNPFKPDRQHLHHYLIMHYSSLNTAITIQLLIWIPFIWSQIFEISLYVLFIQLILYSFIIFRYKI